MQWTTADPGAGDVGVLDLYTRWLAVRIDQLDDAIDQVLRGQGALPAFWQGQAATACQTAVDKKLQILRDTYDHADRARGIVRRYSESIDGIKHEAAKAIASRDAAAAVLDSAPLFTSNNPPTDEVAQAASRKLEAAANDHRAAVRRLIELADERRRADQLLGKQLMQIISAHWSAQSCPTSVDQYRNGANTTVAGILGGFATGQSPRSLFFTDGDAFTEFLKDSSHVRSIRAKIVKGIRGGKLTRGDTRKANREIKPIGENLPVLIEDAVNALTVGSVGNLPQSMLGSYKLEYAIDSVDSRGNAVVTFTAENATTIDSATRIPGGNLDPLREWMEYHEERSGAWATVGQTIVWTETVSRSGYEPATNE